MDIFEELQTLIAALRRSGQDEDDLRRLKELSDET